MLTRIPCMMMRGGTSKGPFFLASDLPDDIAQLHRTLLAVMGSEHIRQIDGIGGGDSLTSKAVIVGRSKRPGIDVEYLFAQVAVGGDTVDTAPNCGNMLSAVGPFAIERGLVTATSPQTTLRIFNRNTGKTIEAIVQTPDGKVTYKGRTAIDGVPGQGAPVMLNFLDAAGAKTGKLLPTGEPIDVINGIQVSCVDFASPLVLIAATALGNTGHETKPALDHDKALFNRVETIRLEAARRMGLGDAIGKVLPKVALLATPEHGGSISSRYLTPWTCHAAHAVTGALCIAAACCVPGSVAASIAVPGRNTGTIAIEHPAGRMEMRVEVDPTATARDVVISRAGVVRTARLLLSGHVFVNVPAVLAVAA
ncbi:MAG: 4-oxalomesaconate tautomerase [Betaproteobacteria bacterium]|nr:MAG: 4-oxalomesaconate tautomerase [Betaproteobacteria bacterium]